MDDDKKQDVGNKAFSKKDGQAWWQPAVMMFLRFSYWIFAPVLIAVFVGKWLDNKCNTEPIIFLATVGLAFLISMFGLVKNVKEEYGKIEDEAKKGDKNKSQNS